MSKWIDGGKFLEDGRFCGTEWESLQRMATFWRQAIDESTDGLKIVEYNHHELHSGKAFKCLDHAATLAIGETNDVLIVTPDTSYRVHFVYHLRVSAEANISLYEAVTTSNDGTTLANYNRRRDVTYVSGVTTFHTPTVTNTGTLIEQHHLGSSQRQGGEDRGEDEWILKPATKYLLRITSESNSNDTSIGCAWYEHTDHKWWSAP